MQQIQGDPGQNLLIQILPCVGKAKMCLRAVHLFIGISISCFFYNFHKNMRVTNIFWLYKYEVRNAYLQSYNSEPFDLVHPAVQQSQFLSHNARF